MPAPATIGEAVAQRLLGDIGGVVALVASRVYPSKPTQEPTGNYIVYYRTAGGDGVRLGERSGLQNYTVRVEATAETQAAAESIIDAVIARLAGPPVWVDKANGVSGCFAQGDKDEDVLEDGRQVSGQSFSVWFKPQT